MHNINRELWTRLIDSHQQLFQFPSFQCGGLFGEGVPGTIFRELEIGWISATLNRPTNSGHLARPIKDRKREHEQAATQFNTPGVLYLYRKRDDITDFLTRHGLETGRCGYLDNVMVCSHDMDLSSLH